MVKYKFFISESIAADFFIMTQRKNISVCPLHKYEENEARITTLQNKFR
jgi:hypothetical protein